RERLGQATTLELVQPFENQIIYLGSFHRNSLEVGRKMRNNSLANWSHTLKCNTIHLDGRYGIPSPAVG
ncbi:hypothetical protein A2U01_0080560, partial [Trifolium medium]|nr:hypothetical protein [Trifolium medium]